MADNNSPATEPVSTKEKAPMSTGAKVAIGCGVVALVLIICGAVVFGLGMFGLNKAEDELNNLADSIDEVGTFTEDDQKEWDAAASINENVTVGDIAWKVLEVEDLGATLPAIDDWSDDCVSDSGRYIYVKGTVKNNGSENVSLSSVYLLDAEGRQFEGESSLYGCIEEDLLFWEDLNPGLNTTFVVVYEVPADATDLKLQVSNLDWFTEVDKYIDLGL